MKFKIIKDYYHAMYDTEGESDTLIVAIGDSWTQGANRHLELEDIEKTYEIFFYQSYPYKLAKRMNAHCINMGKGGGSNQYIYEALVEILPKLISLKNKYKRIILLPTYTTSMRTSDWFSDDDAKTDISFFNLKERIGNRKHIYPYYVQNMDNTRKWEMATMQICINIQSLCKAYDFEYYEGNAFGPFMDDYLVKTEWDRDDELLKYCSNYYRIIDFSRNVICKGKNEYNDFLSYLWKLGKEHHNDHDHYFAKCQHPNAEGYELIADKFYDFIVEYNDKK